MNIKKPGTAGFFIVGAERIESHRLRAVTTQTARKLLQ